MQNLTNKMKFEQINDLTDLLWKLTELGKDIFTTAELTANVEAIEKAEVGFLKDYSNEADSAKKLISAGYTQTWEDALGALQHRIRMSIESVENKEQQSG